MWRELLLSGLYGVLPEIVRDGYGLYTPAQQIERAIQKLKEQLEKCEAQIAKLQKEFEKKKASIPAIVRSSASIEIKEMELYSALREQDLLASQVKYMFEMRERLAMSIRNQQNRIILMDAEQFIKVLLENTQPSDVENLAGDTEKIDENLYVAQRQNEDAMRPKSQTVDSKIHEEVRRLLGTQSGIAVRQLEPVSQQRSRKIKTALKS